MTAVADIGSRFQTVLGAKRGAVRHTDVLAGPAATKAGQTTLAALTSQPMPDRFAALATAYADGPAGPHSVASHLFSACLHELADYAAADWLLTAQAAFRWLCVPAQRSGPVLLNVVEDRRLRDKTWMALSATLQDVLLRDPDHLHSPDAAPALALTSYRDILSEHAADELARTDAGSKLAAKVLFEPPNNRTWQDRCAADGLDSPGCYIDDNPLTWWPAVDALMPELSPGDTRRTDGPHSGMEAVARRSEALHRALGFVAETAYDRR